MGSTVADFLAPSKTKRGIHVRAHTSCQKIVNLSDIGGIIFSRHPAETVVQCHGVFDLLHVGHIKHLKYAKILGDVLIVTITSDRFVNKGPGRPCFTEYLRAEMLAALACVDYVVINDHPTAIEAIRLIKPNFYVKGIEYKTNDITGKISEEEAAVQSVGGELKFTDDIVFSSSSLLNRHFSPFSKEVVSYLEGLKARYPVKDILSFLENAKSLKVLLIGEAIIDVYHYSEVIGKSGKEPVLVAKHHREETYAGGILAIANHLSSFCSKITCLTMIGEDAAYEPFIRKTIKKNVEVIFHYKQASPTIVKRRYLEEYTLQKLFEVYEINDDYLEVHQRKEFINDIDRYIADHDVVIVADYGHGLLDSECISKIEEQSRFLAVNTQSNASNHGFNCISKYKKADYICIANRELQLNFRQRHISIFQQLEQLSQEFDYRNIIITKGREGSFVYKKNEGIKEVPAFTTSVKDRVGAGDAVLAITSLCMVQDAPAEMVGFIGNAVGAEAVNIMGNQSFIEKIPLMKHVTHLLS